MRRERAQTVHHAAPQIPARAFRGPLRPEGSETTGEIRLGDNAALDSLRRNTDEAAEPAAAYRRIELVPAQRRHEHPVERASSASSTRSRGATRHAVRGWMIVLPVDMLALLAPIPFHETYTRGLFVMCLLTVALLASGGFYRPRLQLSLLDDLPGLLGRLLVASALVASVVALRHETPYIEGFFRASIAMTFLLLCGRAVTTWAIGFGRRRGLVSHRCIIVGTGTVAEELGHVLRRYPQYGLQVIGFVDAKRRPKSAVTSPRIGDLDDLGTVLAVNAADVLLIADPDVTDGRFADLLREAMGRIDDILVVPRMHQFQTQTGFCDHIGGIPIMRIRPPKLTGWRWMLKRATDVVVSACALVLLSPVLAMCAVAVRIEGGSGVLFRQQRVGRDHKLFNMLKFRSLRPANETESQTTWSVANDRRVGPVGRLLRRTSLDELPQLWNVLRGDMTLVGPRPERPYFVERFSAEHRLYKWRHRVPAGLTGLAQVSGLRGDTPISDRARFDNYYIENWSIWLEFKIIVRTLREVFAPRGR